MVQHAFFFLLLLVTTLQFPSTVHAMEFPGATFQKIAPQNLPTLEPEGKIDNFRLAVKRQADRCREYEQGKSSFCSKGQVTVPLWCDPTLYKVESELAQSPAWPEFVNRMRTKFDWYMARDKDLKSDAFITGYNTPTFPASLVRTAKFQFPIYAKPKDLIALYDPDGTIKWRKRLPDGLLTKYDDRKVIDVDGSLVEQNLEIAYLESPIAAFKLQLEGAGVLLIDVPGIKPKEMLVQYKASNGLPYSSIFKHLADRGVNRGYFSMDGLHKYFEQYPEEIWPTLTSNPRYIFFKKSNEPPCGTGDVHLTDGHSLAIDMDQLPLGVVSMVAASRPLVPKAPGLPVEQQDFLRFAVTQDSGGAIQGPLRVDFYWGSDAYAAFASDHMQSKGKLYFPIAR